MQPSRLLLIVFLGASVASATDRRFTYTYEPEVFPQGAAEFEQWVTLQTQRSRGTGVENYNRWRLRQEFEYGVTDFYTASLYLNTKATSFRDAATGESESKFEFGGISIENRYLVWDPVEHAVGLTLYLEPGFSGEEAELEQKIIIGQRHGPWKWALNLVHETEWELNEHETEGVLELDFGLARQLNSRWAVGIEVRIHSEIAEYEDWEHVAFFVGPVVSYRQETWWAALTVLPQVSGIHTGGGPDPDGESGLVLDEHERVEIRLIFGIDL